MYNKLNKKGDFIAQKIAVIHDLIYPNSIGGAEVRYWEIMKRLGKTYFVKFFPLNDNIENVIINNIEIKSVGFKLENTYDDKNKRSFINILIWSFSIFFNLLKEKFDIYECNGTPYIHILLIKPIVKMYKGKLVVTLHELLGNFWENYYNNFIIIFLFKTIEKLSLHMADVIIIPSMFYYDDILKLGIDKNKIIVIPNGLDINYIEKINASSFKSDILYAGRLVDYKNVFLLLESFNHVKKIMDITLFIIGSGPEKIKLKKYVQKYKLKNVVFFDFFKEHKDLISYMKSSKIFILPSIREGFSIVTIEAMCCGLPVICIDSQYNAAKIHIKNGINGYVVKPTYIEMSNKIIQILENINRIKYSENSKKYARKYDWNNVTKKYIKNVLEI